MHEALLHTQISIEKNNYAVCCYANINKMSGLILLVFSLILCGFVLFPPVVFVVVLSCGMFLLFCFFSLLTPCIYPLRSQQPLTSSALLVK